MATPIQTTVAVAHRSISQLQPDGTTRRYSLARLGNGDVFWRRDTFAAPSGPTEPMRWLDHHGPMTVADVMQAAPGCERVIRTWTRTEIAAGVADAEWLTEDRRAAALTRLAEELAAADQAGLGTRGPR